MDTEAAGGGHGHDHVHSPAAEAMPGPSEGPVVLDIGGDVGAAVVLTDIHLEGREIEIRRSGTEWDSSHVAVRARPSAGETVYAAVFPGLREGSYEFRRRHGGPDEPVHRLEVEGGSVAELVWGN